MKSWELEGVGGNELGSDTTPIATANNGDSGFDFSLEWLLLLGFKGGWSHGEGERKEGKKKRNFKIEGGMEGRRDIWRLGKETGGGEGKRKGEKIGRKKQTRIVSFDAR